jgi:hypothetical protein
MSGKRCPGCGEVKGVESFSRDRSRKDGLQSRCKSCARRHREESHEAILECHRRYHAENREAILDRQRHYREVNREAELERQRRYHEENREALLERNRRYREANRDMTRETATRTGEPYTPAEDAHILTSDEPDVVIAVELGRTLDSVNTRRKRLRKAVAA